MILSDLCLFQQNVRVEAAFPEKYLKVLHSSINGTYHRVLALEKGETVIDGALVSVVDTVSTHCKLLPSTALQICKIFFVIYLL